MSGVVAEAKNVIGLGIAAAAEDQLAATFALKSGTRNDIENAMGAVAEIGLVAASLDFQIGDVERIDYRTNIGGDIGVGDEGTVDEPAYLVSTAHMKQVVHHVSPRGKVGDHGEAIGAAGAGRSANFAAAD